MQSGCCLRLGASALPVTVCLCGAHLCVGVVVWLHCVTRGHLPCVVVPGLYRCVGVPALSVCLRCSVCLPDCVCAFAVLCLCVCTVCICVFVPAVIVSVCLLVSVSAYVGLLCVTVCPGATIGEVKEK